MDDTYKFAIKCLVYSTQDTKEKAIEEVRKKGLIGLGDAFEGCLEAEGISDEINKEDVCKQAIDKFGKEKQLDMMIEEMAELTKAIVKYRRYDSNKVWELKMIDEIVDVEIMLEQMKQLLSSREEFDVQLQAKLKRLKTIINGTDSPYRGLKGEDVARGFEKED